MPPETYSITDLARLTGVNVRTIRYYLAQGLLPASGESGPGAHYGEGHLDRLRLTKRLQLQHLPLSEIRRRLAELTDADVAGLLATTAAPVEASTTSALDYVRTVLGAPSAAGSPPAPVAPTGGPPAPPTLAAPGHFRMLRGMRVAEAQPLALPAMRDVEPASLAMEATPAPAAAATTAEAPAATSSPAPATEPPSPERSQWERLVLGPNIELHVRRPLSRLEQRRVERLITIARQVLNEDQS